MAVLRIGRRRDVGQQHREGRSAIGDRRGGGVADGFGSTTRLVAIGDCAAQHNAYAGDGPTRIESIQNANDQGAIVANALTGKPAAASAPPWFWSNQYGVRMQTVGVNRGWTEVVLRGAPDTDAFSAVYLRDGCIIAIDCINATKDFVQGKRLVAERSEVCARLLADPVAPLKSFWAA